MKVRHADLQFGRRATDDTCKAFHQACDAYDLQKAGELLLIMEEKFSPLFERERVQGDRIRTLLQAQARLWSLQCRHCGDIEGEKLSPEQPAAIDQPSTSKVGDWLAAWIRGPQSRFAKAIEFSIKR